MLLPTSISRTDEHNNKPLRAPGRAARASRPLSFKEKQLLNGSMSLEAALAVPLFLFFMMNLLFVFEAVRLQSGLQAALQQAGEKVCEAAYYMKFGAAQGEDGAGQQKTEGGEGSEAASLVLTETYVRNKVTSYLGDEFWKHTCVVGGRAGLSFAGSKIMTDQDRVEIVVSCRVRPFVRIVAFPDYAMQVRYCGHAWVGWTEGSETTGGSGEKTGGKTVYVTRYGTVYHTDPGCIYLNPQIKAVPGSEVGKYRSADGSKYMPCECCKPGKEGIVYITKEGNRYHSDRNCSGIVRHTLTIDSDLAAEHYGECPKCGGHH